MRELSHDYFIRFGLRLHMCGLSSKMSIQMHTAYCRARQGWSQRVIETQKRYKDTQSLKFVESQMQLCNVHMSMPPSVHLLKLTHLHRFFLICPFDGFCFFCLFISAMDGNLLPYPRGLRLSYLLFCQTDLYTPTPSSLIIKKKKG